PTQMRWAYAAVAAAPITAARSAETIRLRLSEPTGGSYPRRLVAAADLQGDAPGRAVEAEVAGERVAMVVAAGESVADAGGEPDILRQPHHPEDLGFGERETAAEPRGF